MHLKADLYATYPQVCLGAQNKYDIIKVLMEVRSAREVTSRGLVHTIFL